MRQKSRPAVVETLELEDADDLLSSIQELHDAIANDAYVEYGSGYDPDYGEYRGFGDDSWIDEMDSLFAAATGLYRAGKYRTAAAAYIALFDIFGLNEDGYHFTRPDPPAALQTDLNVMKQQLFTALGMLNPDPAAVLEERGEAEDAETLVELSGRLSFYGDDRYALLDAWERHPEWMRSLEAHLLQLCRHPAHQERSSYYGLSHHAQLLREALSGAPRLVREQGALLDATAVMMLPNPFFDGAVRTYERLLTRAVDGRKRESYAVAGSYARVIGAIRKLQGRGDEFDAYYRSLFETYARLPAFKDELRRAIEGPGYKRKH